MTRTPAPQLSSFRASLTRVLVADGHNGRQDQPAIQPRRGFDRWRAFSIYRMSALHGVLIDFTELGRSAWLRGGVHAVLDNQRANGLHEF
ncbi:MAG: hypothetical protein ACK5MR_17625 [Cumulibacter sp.]